MPKLASTNSRDGHWKTPPKKSRYQRSRWTITYCNSALAKNSASTSIATTTKKLACSAALSKKWRISSSKKMAIKRCRRSCHCSRAHQSATWPTMTTMKLMTSRMRTSLKTAMNKTRKWRLKRQWPRVRQRKAEEDRDRMCSKLLDDKKRRENDWTLNNIPPRNLIFKNCAIK